MSLDVSFSVTYDRYQLYNFLDGSDWELAVVNVHVIKGQVFFDIILFDKLRSKVAPIFLNAFEENKLIIPNLLKTMDKDNLSKILGQSITVISTYKDNIKPPNTTIFTENYNYIKSVDNNVNPHRRAFVGIGNAMYLKFILFYKHVAEIIRLRNKKGKKLNILDCSCSSGYGSIILGSIENAIVCGADMDEGAINLAKMLNLDKENVSFVNLPMEDLHKFGSKYDYVVSLETIEHVEDPERFLNSATDLLEENGTLILSVPHWRYHGSDLNSDHVTNWTPEKIKRFFDRFFERIEIYFTEIVNLDDVLNQDFNLKEEMDKKTIENIFVIAKLKNRRYPSTFYVKKKPRRILFVNHSILPYEHTGTPLATYSQMKHIRALGYETAALIPHSDATTEFKKENVLNETIYKIYPLNWQERFLDDAFSGYNLRGYLSLVEDVLDDYKPDVIHLGDYVGMSSKIIELFEAKGIPICKEVHAIEELCLKIRPSGGDKDGLCTGPESPEKCARCALNSMYELNETFLIRHLSEIMGKLFARFKYINYLYTKFDAVVFPSSSWMKYMMNYIKINRDKAFVVPIGVDIKLPRKNFTKEGFIERKSLNLAYLGTVAMGKGLGILEKLFKDKELLSRNFKFYIYGRCQDSKSEERIKSLEEESFGKVIYMGSYERDDLPKILASIDLGILPYLYESYSIVTRELLYFGIPVISFNTYGIDEILKNYYNGFLVEVGNVEKMKERIICLLDNKELIAKLKEGALSTPITTPQEEAHMLDDIYKKIARK
ncbi:glycosyl transferase group 1 [Thermodesulfobium narugense DSM 14796]|uniref:Glycosyl transferase group 1 n=1 Tax=Thermodesulfobium narugense DSM 14796 TaxID=747365 RepID=M1E760_9BACT|nr:glycosyltransferase [Thermodesulfobium narugense]AEE13829.1 glycosyl transferase group 1 [Thermodesulfobium narugense DSM 14796]